LKKYLTVVGLASVLFATGIFSQHIYAEENVEIQSKQIQSEATYSMVEKKEMLTEIANSKGIPAEVLKAIAYQETGMKQFTPDGQPLITEDGGIGIMQVTLSPEELERRGIDVDSLKWDTRYNIEVGADILLEKWNLNLPKVNNHSKKHLEDWYFAVMAYNGLSKRNDPNLNQPDPAYQEEVYQYIRDYSLLEVGETPEIEINYPNQDEPEIMSFPAGVDYKWPTSIRTTQDLQVGDVVYTSNPYLSYSNLRDGVDGDRIKTVEHYTPLEIVAGPYETAENPDNQYVMYKVKGNGFEGYIASANTVYSEKLELFPDIDRGEVARAVSYLQVRNIVNGYDDGTYKPYDALLRRHAAKLLVKALDLELPQGYEMKATDMEPGDMGYHDMMVAEAHGLMGDGGKLRPEENLTRSQMAAILTRAFEDYYEEPDKNYTFSDQEEFWNYDDINTLAHNNITVADPFNSYESTTRAHFALFLERTIKLKEIQE
jgi:hypothetical protein